MSIAYFNAQAENWDYKAAEKDLTRLRSIADFLDIEAGSTVLDVGTGTGILIPYLLEKLGTRGKLVCLDYAIEMLKKARSKVSGAGIDYICADIIDGCLSGGIFEAVVCYSSFPHFRDKPAALRQIYRILKTGGKLFICHTAGRDKINEIHRHLPGLSEDLLPAEEELHRLLSAAGFREIGITDDKSSYLARAVKHPDN